MSNYMLYSANLEQPGQSEPETIQKIIDLMVDGHRKTEEKYGRSIRISHA